MAEQKPLKITTSKYVKRGKVDVDGNIWDVVLPGAGTELRFSQASRACKLYAARVDILTKKIDNGTVSNEELDKYEEYSRLYDENEKVIYEIFQNTFKDGTEDNKTVIDWVYNTPTVLIMMAFEDVKEQANGTKESETEEPTGQPKSE